jgi:hypothetical protein
MGITLFFVENCTSFLELSTLFIQCKLELISF